MLSYTLYNTVIRKIGEKKPNRSKRENDWQYYGSFPPRFLISNMTGESGRVFWRPELVSKWVQKMSRSQTMWWLIIFERVFSVLIFYQISETSTPVWAQSSLTFSVKDPKLNANSNGYFFPWPWLLGRVWLLRRAHVHPSILGSPFTFCVLDSPPLSL